jgi:hypothetical protein
VNDEQFEATTAERIAYNQERCRAVRAEGRTSGFFLCECADPMCRKTIALTLDEYAGVRSKPTHYIAAVHHQGMAGSIALVVRELAEYVVVERSSRYAEGIGTLARGAA